MGTMPASELTIKCFALGPWVTNCYVIHRVLPDKKVAAKTAGAAAVPPRPCWIIDAGFQPQPLLEYVRNQRLQPQKVILTHAHLDHIAGLLEMQQAFPTIDILIHSAEKEFLTDPELNLSAVMDEEIIAPPATALLEHGQRLELEGVTFEVRHTPGHSPGGISLIQAQAAVALVGDALFQGSIGRTDFPSSDSATLIQSIRSQLFTLPDATRVLSGHGAPTTIGQEKRGNPYVGLGT
jgi:glyoxylase-like metal-dependent hydrolase (beta-lactamase superfamily II)